MPEIPKHLKVKHSQRTVLVKKKHFLKNFPVVKSCKLLCKQLQSNNNSLAKALSKEKQESQLLFSENVDLTAMVQELGLACNKRDAVMSNILRNAKEMLQMIVTMSGFLTNTISYCQEFTKSAGTNARSYNSAGRKDSMKRLSMKSPTRGVVKPMVSGHTITKPTINLSRLNMQNINNSSNLSIIPEVTTPPRNEESNSSVSMRLRRYTNGRKCRMPERLNIARGSDENERRLNETRRRHSGKLSGRLSKSRSSMNASSRYSVENFENIGSPRVKLNDVSKLLQNSQTINVRMLEENQNNADASSEIDDTVIPDGSVSEVSRNDVTVTLAPRFDPDEVDRGRSYTTISEIPPSNDSTDDRERSNGVRSDTPPLDSPDRVDRERNHMSETTPTNDCDKDDGESDRNQTSNNTSDEQERKGIHTREDLQSNWEDPLEGPSWLFNNSETVPFKEKKTDNVDDSSDNDMSLILTGMESDKESSDGEERIKRVMPLPSSSAESNLDNTEEENDENRSPRFDNNDLPNSVGETSEDNEIGNVAAMNRENFVTQRRGCLESEDEDDFTLILPSLRPLNMDFDMNDLKLPVIDQSTLKPQVSVEPEPEVTGRIPLQKISQIFPVPDAQNGLNDSEFNQSTVNLPALVNNDDGDDDDDEATPSKEELRRKGKKQSNRESNCSNGIDTVRRSNNRSKHKKKKNKSVKDPSSAKVVLEKLNESDIKPPSSSKSSTGDSFQPLNSTSLRADVSSDSDSNASSSSIHTSSRPRRRRAPIALQEPNLRKKLRRND